jgi:GDP-L-fucose synthase
MKILITGGSGLVGYSINNLVKENYKNISDNNEFIFWNSSNCDLINKNEDIIFLYMQNISPDIVIHLAANVGGLYKNMNHNVQMFNDNLVMNMNIINVCKRLNVKVLFSCLSTCIFPDNVEYPIKEEYLHNGSPHYSNNGYSYAKRFLDIYTSLLNVENNSNTLYVNFIPTNLFGNNDNYNLQDAHVLPALIHKAYLAEKNNDNFEIKGSGKALRIFTSSDDFAKIILDFITFYQYDNLNNMKKLINVTRENQNNYNFIVSDNETNEISIKNIVTILGKYFNIPNEKINFDKNFSDGQLRKPASNNRLKMLYNQYNEEFNFENLEDKINKVCNYFVTNYVHIRK